MTPRRRKTRLERFLPAFAVASLLFFAVVGLKPVFMLFQGESGWLILQVLAGSILGSMAFGLILGLGVAFSNDRLGDDDGEPPA